MVVLVRWTLPVAGQEPTTPNLEHTKWQLVRFEERGGAIMRPDDPGKYTIEFADLLNAHFDCATGSSTWMAPAGDLRIGKLKIARKGCAPGSMADRLIDDWRDIRSYSVRAGLLHVALKKGRGWYVFEASRFPATAGRFTVEKLRQYAEQAIDSAPTSTDYSPFIKFDAKGVEFAPWIRRFVAKVKRNWFVPALAMSLQGHVVVTFNVHKDGALTDVTLVGPSQVDSFNAAVVNALVASNPAEPLPAEYPTEKAFFTLTFFYNERPPDGPAVAPPK